MGAYAEAVGWDTTDVEFIATRLSLVPMAGSKAPRKVVITQGPTQQWWPSRDMSPSTLCLSWLQRKLWTPMVLAMLSWAVSWQPWPRERTLRAAAKLVPTPPLSSSSTLAAPILQSQTTPSEVDA